MVEYVIANPIPESVLLAISRKLPRPRTVISNPEMSLNDGRRI